MNKNSTRFRERDAKAPQEARSNPTRDEVTIALHAGTVFAKAHFNLDEAVFRQRVEEAQISIQKTTLSGSGSPGENYAMNHVMASLFAMAAMQEWKQARNDRIDGNIRMVIPFSRARVRRT